MKHNLEDYSLPTPTQIYADPANLAQMDKLAEMHMNKLEASRLLEEFDAEMYVEDTRDGGQEKKKEIVKN